MLLKNKEFQANQYITLKLEYNKTTIYINNTIREVNY